MPGQLRPTRTSRGRRQATRPYTRRSQRDTPGSPTAADKNSPDLRKGDSPVNNGCIDL